jgi:hypothetical protein
MLLHLLNQLINRLELRFKVIMGIHDHLREAPLCAYSAR